jgi:hypothetical protein
MVAQQFSKPQEARQIEARARAKKLRVRVAVVAEARSYISNSQSQPGSAYRIERTRHGWGCECDGFRFTGMCKHVAAVERRAEREGWDFGAVAPLVKLIDQPQPIGTARIIERPAPVIDFRPRFIEREASAATSAANADLFGA